MDKNQVALRMPDQMLLKDQKGNVIKNLSSTPYGFEINPAEYRGLNDMMFFGPNGREFVFQYRNEMSAVRAYEYCPPVSAIINRKAQAFINGKTWFLNTRGKEVTTGPLVSKLKELFNKPNPLQSWKQFEAQQYIYMQIFGFCPVLKINPVGFNKPEDIKALWNIPPSMIDIEETKKLFYQTDLSGILKKITINYKGVKQELPIEDLWIFRDFTPSFNSMVIPESRLKSLELPINNILGAYESRNVLINYRGALGILSQDPGTGQYASLPMTETDKEELQNQFRKYGTLGQQWQFIITSASLKWQSMGSSIRELMLFEEVEADTMAISDSYNYPYRLLSNLKSNSLAGADLKEFKKLLYQDAIIPEGESIYEQWNNFFGLKEYNIRIEKDYSHIAVLQEDKLQEAQARQTMGGEVIAEWKEGFITMNRALELLGEDPRPGGDLYYNEWVAANPAPQNQSNETATDTGTEETGTDTGEGGEDETDQEGEQTED